MATSCVLCERLCENVRESTLHVFPEDEDRRKRWLSAIGRTDAEVPARSSLCSRHFSQSCFAGSVLRCDAVPTLELEHPVSASIAVVAAEERSASRESQLCKSSAQHTASRSTIRRRRVHMLSSEEMKEAQPAKYVRYLKSVNWDEISKVPAEAKIAWEVAMEELKEGNDKIKQLQVQVRQLKATIRKLKAALQARTKRAAAAAAAAARHRQSLS